MSDISQDNDYQRKTLPDFISIVWSAIRKGCTKLSDFEKYNISDIQTILDNMVDDKFLKLTNNCYKIPQFKNIKMVKKKKIF